MASELREWNLCRLRPMGKWQVKSDEDAASLRDHPEWEVVRVIEKPDEEPSE